MVDDLAERLDNKVNKKKRFRYKLLKYSTIAALAVGFSYASYQIGYARGVHDTASSKITAYEAFKITRERLEDNPELLQYLGPKAKGKMPSIVYNSGKLAVKKEILELYDKARDSMKDLQDRLQKDSEKYLNRYDATR